MGIESKDRRVRIGFGIANVAVALFVLGGVFRLLPTRWWLVDGGAIIIALLLGGSGVSLLRSAPVAERLTRIAAAIVLVLGLALFSAIALTASWISGVYSQVGTSGAVIFGLVAALVLPYLVVFPAVELAWIGPRPRPAKDELVSPAAVTEEATASAKEPEPKSEDKRGPKPKSRRKKGKRADDAKSEGG
jgi:hypothetical protein